MGVPLEHMIVRTGNTGCRIMRHHPRDPYLDVKGIEHACWADSLGQPLAVVAIAAGGIHYSVPLTSKPSPHSLSRAASPLSSPSCVTVRSPSVAPLLKAVLRPILSAVWVGRD